MTLATKLTLSRIIVIPFFILAFCWNKPDAPLTEDWGKVIAFFIFVFASITDYFDGYLARLHKEVTTFGKFIDPIADKILVSAALIVMVQYESITQTSAWSAVIIMAREFCVTGLRLICVEHGIVIDASKAGKWKTATQLAAIIVCLLMLSLQVVFIHYNMNEAIKSLQNFSPYINYTLMGLAVLATIYSGYDYFKKNWQILQN